MKRIVAVLFVLLLFCVHTYAESRSLLEDLSPEQIAELIALLEEKQSNVNVTDSSEPVENEVVTHSSSPASLKLLQEMIALGAPISSEKLLDFNAITDPNNQLGKPGCYTSKTNYGCVGYANTSDGDYIGGTLERFDDEASALDRYTYLERIYRAIPISCDAYMFLRGKALLRISDMISHDKVFAIIDAFEALIPNAETQSFNAPAKTKEQATILRKGADVDAVSPSASDFELLKKGSKGGGVAKLQSRLKDLGFLVGLADGDYGGQTEKAVKAFQSANGTTVDGIATPELQVIVFSEGAIMSDGTKAKAYDPYEMCPIEISKVDLKSSYGFQYTKFSAKNVSSMSVHAFTCVIQYYDPYGDQLSEFGKSEDTYTHSSPLGIGKSTSVSTDSTSFFVQDAATSRVAVKRVLLDDGTDIVYDDLVWYEGK